MNTLKYFLLGLLFFATAPQAAQAKRVQTPKLYIFGFAASFKDSVVYMTDVQELNNVWIDSKTKFLAGRQHYSAQLKEYLSSQQAPGQNQPSKVCTVIFAEKRKDAEKKFLKLRRKYTVKAKQKYAIRYLNTTEFKFKVVDMSDEE